MVTTYMQIMILMIVKLQFKTLKSQIKIEVNWLYYLLCRQNIKN